MNSGKNIIKNTFSLTISNMVPRFVQTILIFYAARIIGDVGLGKYYTVSSLISIFNLVTDFGINSLLTREVSKDRSATDKYFWNVFWLKLILSIISYFMLIASVKILGYSVEILQAAYIFGIYLIFSTISILIQSFWQAFEDMRYIGTLSAVSALLNLGVSAWLLFRNAGFTSLIWGLLVSSIALLVLNLIIFAKHLHFSEYFIDFVFLKRLLKMSIPFALISIFTTVYFRLDVIFLSKFQSEAVVGWYGSSHKIIEVLQMIPYAFLGAVYPVFSRTFIDAFEKFTFLYRQIYKIILYLGFPISTVLIVLNHEILRLLYGPGFEKADLSLQILAGVLFFLFINSLFNTTCMAIDKIKIITLTSFIDIVLNIGLNLLLIPRWGFNLSLNGASVTKLICELVNFIILSWYLSKTTVKISFFASAGKPFISAVLMGLVVWFLKPFGIWIALIGGVLAYPSALVFFKGITKDEIFFLKNIIFNK